MITKNFAPSEFFCKCNCGTYNPNAALLIILEDVREHFNSPVKINSSTRCAKHNKEVGGAKASKHLLGQAADIVVIGVDPIHVYKYLNERPYADIIGLGKYNSFTHVDTRGTKARW